jgi:type IV pilus modification protein PilV
VTSSQTPQAPNAERGFTIVELLVAVMILSIGLLSMAGTSAVMMEMLAASQTRTLAASVAQSRFERIRATACASRASGSAVTRGTSESWTINHLARADEVTVTITFQANHRVRSTSFESYLPC